MPGKKADYPDWVMKYKTKGTYINRVGDKYYLYAAHSERIKGTDKVRRVSDGYIGRITQADGLIRSKPKLKKPPVSFETGLSFTILSVTSDIRKGLKISYRKNGDLIYCCAILSFIYGSYSLMLYERSYLSMHIPDLVIPERLPPTVLIGIDRGKRMLNDTLSNLFGEDLYRIIHFFPDIRLLDIDGTLYLTGTNDITESLSDKYQIKWEDPTWQK